MNELARHQLQSKSKKQSKRHKSKKMWDNLFSVLDKRLPPFHPSSPSFQSIKCAKNDSSSSVVVNCVLQVASFSGKHSFNSGET
ncbi:hypothetical protein BLOT_001359 [Blomia tropicalis]|nr:hypothetical protein BLOT_001359 [Blomia tropicalis]